MRNRYGISRYRFAIGTLLYRRPRRNNLPTFDWLHSFTYQWYTSVQGYPSYLPSQIHRWKGVRFVLKSSVKKGWVKIWIDQSCFLVINSRIVQCVGRNYCILVGIVIWRVSARARRTLFYMQQRRLGLPESRLLPLKQGFSDAFIMKKICKHDVMEEFFSVT